jgi:hypothetical protein
MVLEKEFYMKMKMFVAAALIVCFQNSAFAKPRYYKKPSSSPVVKYEYKSVSYTSGNSDQERCQAEANHMAANNITGHVWGVIGRFEGVGYGSSPKCSTCTPGSNMTLTGDASAQGRNGLWYRVRSWR